MDKCTLPQPPSINDGELNIPKYFQSNHPYTKWMLNMLRGGATYRINTMLNERPELFEQIYQIPDIPEVVIGGGSSAISHGTGRVSGACGGGGSGQPFDSLPMFNRHTVLYLNALCLAIYMKKEKAAILILKSGLIKANQKCWATEVFSRTQTGSGDVMEIYPIFIAIRREFFEPIPFMTSQRDFLTGKLCKITNGKTITNDYFSISDRLDVRYERREIKKLFRYRDSLQYALDTLRKRGNFPLSRLLELFIMDCSDSSIKTDSDKDGNINSLFFRIIKFAFTEDVECRITTQLIQCLDMLLKHKYIPWTSTILKNRTVSDNGDSSEAIVKDFSNSLTLLLGLYDKIQSRIKNGPLDNLGYLIIKTLQSVQLKDQFCKMASGHLLEEFGHWNGSNIITSNTINIIQRHITAIMDLEKERQFKSRPSNSNKQVKNSGFVFKTKSHQRSLSSKDKTYDNKHINLLQCSNKINFNKSKQKDNSQSTKLNKSVETIKPSNLQQLYTYQTGANEKLKSKVLKSPIQIKDIKIKPKTNIKLEKPIKIDKCINIPDNSFNFLSNVSLNSSEIIPNNNDYHLTTQKILKNSEYGVHLNLNLANNNYVPKQPAKPPRLKNRNSFQLNNKLNMIPSLIDDDEIESLPTNNDILNFEDEIINELYREYNSCPNINYENNSNNL